MIRMQRVMDNRVLFGVVKSVREMRTQTHSYRRTNKWEKGRHAHRHIKRKKRKRL